MKRLRSREWEFVKGSSPAHIEGVVCAPAQRKPFELIVIKTLTFRYLPLTNKVPRNGILRHKRSHCQDYLGKLCFRHGFAKAPELFHTRSHRCPDPDHFIRCIFAYSPIYRTQLYTSPTSDKLLSPDAQSILLPQALKPSECQAQPVAAILRQSCKKTRSPKLTQPKPHNNPHNQTRWRKTMNSRISR